MKYHFNKINEQPFRDYKRYLNQYQAVDRKIIAVGSRKFAIEGFGVRIK